MSEIEPFVLHRPEDELADLRRRLDAIRWPERETVDDWSQGVPLERLQELCRYWRDNYDWRRCEAILNGFGQYRTHLDGLQIHFIHVRSPEPGALPLIMTHGWPGSVIEFHKVVGPLTDPAAHGGDPADAFHLVLPSLPGYGFSERPARTGWTVERIARSWLTLMQRLGYDRFVAQGGDWGSAVTTALAHMHPPQLAGIHLNMPIVFPNSSEAEEWTEQEAAVAADMHRFGEEETGYSTEQRTRPQTLGYGLADSPVGQAAWIYEKYYAWSDCRGNPANVFTFDEMLDNIMLYWLPAAGASSGRLYWESMSSFRGAPTDVPCGCSIFPKEVMRPSRRWAERTYRNIVYWNELDRGGHFAAFEQPQLFVEELRACFRQFH